MNLKELLFGGGVQSGDSGGAYRDSIQAWLPIKNIIGGVVITKDNRFVKILEVLPVNIYLKSTNDRQNIISSFAAYLEAIDVMLELTENAPIFYSQDRLLEPCLLRFGGDGEMLGLLFSVTWLDIPGRIAAAPRMKGERIIWITDCVDMGSINLPKHHFFAHRQQDGTHRFYGSSESERNQDQEVN